MPGWFCEEALCVKAPCPTRPRCVKINDTETVPNDRRLFTVILVNLLNIFIFKVV